METEGLLHKVVSNIATEKQVVKLKILKYSRLDFFYLTYIFPGSRVRLISASVGSNGAVLPSQRKPTYGDSILAVVFC